MNNIVSTKFGIFSIAMLSIAGVFSIRGLSSMAEYGPTLITYYFLAGILYLIPSSLIFAELGSAFPRTGGLYIWVKEAHGSRLGFLAIWLEWINNIVALPTMLSFGVTILAYIITPTLATNKMTLFELMLFFLWGTTLLNMLGVRTSILASSITTLLGMVIPASIILLLGAIWLILGKPSQIHFSATSLVPSFHWRDSGFLAGLTLAYAGMQIAGFHAQDIEDPKKNYPRAMLIAALIILVLSIFGSLSIAAVIPQKEISLLGGVMQVIQKFLETFHLGFLIPLIAILIFLGFFSSLNTWLLGPSRGLQVCAQYGNLPKILSYTNKRGTPLFILILQAIIGSLLACVFLFMPSVNASYWILTVLSAQLTFIMNIIVFSAVIRLRYTRPTMPRGYAIPGGMLGVSLIASAAMLVCLLSFTAGFFPPPQINTGSKFLYDGFLIIGIGLFTLPGLKAGG
jgi:amino acid transporter